jgi:hypothetical protein
MDSHVPRLPSAFFNRQYHLRNIHHRSSTRAYGCRTTLGRSNGTTVSRLDDSGCIGWNDRKHVRFPPPHRSSSTILLTSVFERGGCLAPTDNFKGTQLWNIPAKNSAGPIRLAGSNQCLDAGTQPLANGRTLKTWTWCVSCSSSLELDQ